MGLGRSLWLWDLMGFIGLVALVVGFVAVLGLLSYGDRHLWCVLPHWVCHFMGFVIVCSLLPNEAQC